MESRDLIITDVISESIYEDLLSEAINYAIISIPFTFNRLSTSDLKKKITNIAKGKFAENIFFEYARNMNIQVDFTTTTTPFYNVDKRDFLFNGKEWDIKNNFLIHEGDHLFPEDYLKLPALIPNRGEWDQWGKRNKLHFASSKGSSYLFTFMKKCAPGERRDFFSINISFSQEMFIRDLYEKFQGKAQSDMPFTPEWFWDQFNKLSGNYSVVLDFKPQMVITGYADNTMYEKFEMILPSQLKNPYLTTIIPNMGCTVSSLLPFKDEFSNNE